MDRVVRLALANKEDQWEALPDGLVLRQGRIYVPRDQKLREDIIRTHHDSRIDGHPGQYKTVELITRNYWWPGVHFDVRRYVSGCDTCQRTKPHRAKPNAPLNPNEVPSSPWEIVSVDIIGELPESQGHNAICVTVDRFSKMIHLTPIDTSLTAEGMAKIYRDQIFRLHGIPRKFIHDRGPQFEAKFMKELYKLVGIEANSSTAFHPQTDGQTERINQEVEQYLRIFINHRQSDWVEWLSLAEFAYNNREHSSTKQSPFFVNYGRHPYTGTNPRRESTNESAKQFADRMQQVREETRLALEEAAALMKRYYDQRRGPSQEYKPGDKVMLEGVNISSTRPMKKLGDKRYGPFVIEKKVGKAAYRLKLPPHWKRLHPVFNEVLLTPYKDPVFPSQRRKPPPPPDLVKGVEEWEVEKILDSRVYYGKLQYLVHWKGYPVSERTWEPAANVKHAQEEVEEFHRLHPGAPRTVTRTRMVELLDIMEKREPTEPSSRLGHPP